MYLNFLKLHPAIRKTQLMILSFKNDIVISEHLTLGGPWGGGDWGVKWRFWPIFKKRPILALFDPKIHYLLCESANHQKMR